MKKQETYKRILQTLGFKKDSAEVYLFLLKNPNKLPTDIVKSTSMHRPAVYRALAELVEKGLVFVSTHGKRIMYSAETPAKLEQIFKSVESDFLDSIEDMYKEFEATGNKPTVSIQGGEEAIRDAYRDVVHYLDKDETYYRYSSIAHFKRSKYVPRDYEYIRDKKGLERFVITGAKNIPHMKRLGRSVKVVPKEFDLFQDGMNMIIYKDKVAIVDYVSDTTITIKHKVFAEFQRKLFKLLYSKI